MRDIESPLGLKERVLLSLIDVSGYLTRPLDYRGYYILNKWIGRAMSPGTTAQIRLNSDALFEFVISDPYWNRLIHRGYCYEAEIFYFLELLKGDTFSFVDGGSNWGYWSIMASSSVYGATETVAYEPMPQAYSMLVRNSAINNNRFRTINKAIAGQDMANVAMTIADVAELSAVGASISAPVGDDNSTILVEAVGIDRVLGELTSSAPAVIKLDLEGVERDVIEAATWINDHDCVLVFEDHGADTEHKVAAAVMARDWPVYFFHRDGRLARVNSLDHVAALKTVSHRGYNFFGAHPGGKFDRLLAAHAGDR
ncbi:MAG: FkbM family methyltransferase [Gammaproteobacteria bacterium]|nr:FkbM family methyltransferase [Gammaproteobacteria bacterium]